MAVIHVVLFKFKQETSRHILDTFVTELRKLKCLSCVHEQNLIVGGPSITTPIARSRGFNFCLLSYHKDRAALEEYQASNEHHNVTSKYMWPFNEDLIRFDFETEQDNLDHLASLMLAGKQKSDPVSSESPVASSNVSSPGSQISTD